MHLFSPKDRPDVATIVGADAPRQSIWHRISLRAAIFGVLIIAGLAYLLTKMLGPTEAQAEPPVPTVTIAQPLQRSIVEWDDYSGRFEASQWVEIKPRVSGQLAAVHFRDGDIVRPGQLLFTIDQRPFLAALNEARARVRAARSALALARSELGRATALIDEEAISREEVDTRRAAVASAEAQVAALDAIVQQRALDLDFTHIRAPIGGRISDRRIHAGNLVAANETLLTTVMALNPIHFTFDGSEALYLRSLRNRAANSGAQTVEIRLQDETNYSRRGQVDFTDNRIAPDSGTMRGRAVVANPDYFLTPGMFGNMRLSTGARTNALLVPDAAVMTDQARKIVLVTLRDGTVEARPVELGARIGSLRTIRAGLKPTDNVIVEGLQMARPGSKVNVRSTRLAAASQKAAPPTTIAPPPSQATLAN